MAHKQTHPISINNKHNNLDQVAFAVSDNNDNATADQNSTATDQQSKDEEQSDERTREDAVQSQGQNNIEG